MQFRPRKLLLVLLAGVRILPKDEKTLPHQYNHSLKQKTIKKNYLLLKNVEFKNTGSIYWVYMLQKLWKNILQLTYK